MNAWAFYDWANSVYSLVITSTIFPIYYSIITTASEKTEIIGGHQVQIPVRIPVHFFGKSFNPDAIYGYSLTLSFLVVVFISPILSATADTIGNKKSFLKFFCYLGSFSCIGLAWFTDINTVYIGLLFSVLASVGYWGSLVFYNSFLPDIASNEKQDALSAKGFVLGYIGSVLLVLLCLVLILLLAKTPEQSKFLTRVSFLLTGIWWMSFSQYTFRHLPKFSIEKEKILRKGSRVAFLVKLSQKSFKELFSVGKRLFKTGNLNFFLISFFFYSVGMQTIFLMATLFGKSEINLSQDKLIATLLVIQIEAIFGAMFFAWLSKKIGNKNVISIAVVLWIVACVSAYFLRPENPMVEYQFYGVAAIIGLVMGGLQAMSRSTYSKLLPTNGGDTTTFFSFYDVLEKIAIIIGSLVFATLIEHYNNMRFSTLAMSIFFFLGLIFIRFVKNSPKTVK